MKKLSLLVAILVSTTLSFAQPVNINTFNQVRMFNPSNASIGANVTDSIHTSTTTYFQVIEPRKGKMSVAIHDTAYASFTGYAVLQVKVGNIWANHPTATVDTLTAASGYHDFCWNIIGDYAAYRVKIVSSGGSISVIVWSLWKLDWAQILAPKQ